ncbi:hypothetical protein HanRHA438_Chr07g0297251 [Helianthus annuus]|nr:hypothetical protein HanRHA438_Chr07g0297251 [Helianthus annuus]
MSYYSKSKADLAKIGVDGFALLDFFSVHKSNHKHSTSIAPPNQNTTFFHYQHYRQQPYVVRQKVYAPQVQVTKVETVVDWYEAANRYGGTVYAMKNPTRKGYI